MTNQDKKQQQAVPVDTTVKQYKTLEFKSKGKIDEGVNKLAKEGWTLKSQDKEKRFMRRDKFRAVMEREVASGTPQPGTGWLMGLLNKMTTKQRSIAIVALFVIFIAWALMAGDGTSPPTTTTQPPASQEPQITDEEKIAKQQKATEDLVGYLNIFKGDPHYFVSNWHPGGIDNEFFVVEVDPDVWDSMLYDLKEKFMRDVGGISDAVGYNSVWFVNNRTRDKLADYRHGRVDIK